MMKSFNVNLIASDNNNWRLSVSDHVFVTNWRSQVPLISIGATYVSRRCFIFVGKARHTNLVIRHECSNHLFFIRSLVQYDWVIIQDRVTSPVSAQTLSYMAMKDALFQIAFGDVAKFCVFCKNDRHAYTKWIWLTVKPSRYQLNKSAGTIYWLKYAWINYYKMCIFFIFYCAYSRNAKNIIIFWSFISLCMRLIDLIKTNQSYKRRFNVFNVVNGDNACICCDVAKSAKINKTISLYQKCLK